MNTRLTVENLKTNELLCTLELPSTNGPENFRITMSLPKDQERTLPQLEFQMLQRARDLLGEMCKEHPESKRV